MPHYRFQCTVDAAHKYSVQADAGTGPGTDGTDCPEPACAGRLRWIVNPRSRSPGTYASRPVNYLDLVYRKIAIERSANTRRVPSAEAVKKRTASEALGAEADARFDAESAAAPAAKVAKMHHVETIDVEDPDYVGEVAFNPETRLFAHALCDPFAAVTTSSTACRLKSSNIFSTNVDIKGGRKNGKTVMGKSASKAMQDASHSTVPDFKCVTNRNKQHGEWCHLQADSLGGKSVPANFVAARFAANTYMMVIEHAVAKRPYFAMVEAHGERGVNDETPQAILYHLWRSDPNIGGAGVIPAPHLTFVINPAMQSFTRDDQQAVHRLLKSHHFSSINPIG